MESTLKQLLSALLLFTIFSCEDTTIIKNYTGTGEEKTYSVEGYAQKGPFIVGSSVTVSELSEDLYPTGRVFFATVLDNTGRFELPGVILVSSYIQIKVDGSYFSEFQGGVPTGESLTLYSIADISRSETINVNILTHLEKERVEYLVQEESKSFSEAKEQALEELLQVFDLDDYSVDASEDLSMLSESEGNAVLLAVSAIVEGVYNYEKRLALITNFQKDFQDGTLDAVNIQNTLLTSAFSLDAQLIIDNLTTKFSGITVPDFEPVLEHFIDNSEYTNYFADLFTGQPSGAINLLNAPDGTVALDPTKEYVFFINPPQGVEVGLSINMYNSFYSDEATFTSSSSSWTIVHHSDSCPPEDPHCLVEDSYSLHAHGSNLDPIEIPITSFTGNGDLEINFEISIDGFSSSKIRFSKQLTW